MDFDRKSTSHNLRTAFVRDLHVTLTLLLFNYFFICLFVGLVSRTMNAESEVCTCQIVVACNFYAITIRRRRRRR